MAGQRIRFSRMTDRAIVSLFHSWLSGINKDAKIKALEYLLERRSPKERTFLKLHDHLTMVDPKTAVSYRNFYSVFAGWSGLEALLNSRENQIHGKLQSMQELTYYKSHKTKPLPIHMWLRNLEVKGKLPGITDLLHRQEEQISHMAKVQLTIQRMFPEMFLHGILFATEQFDETKKREKQMIGGESVIPSDWRIKVNPRFKEHLRQVVEEYYE